MKMERFALALLALNAMLLLPVAARTGSSTGEPVAPIVRTRAFELVDDGGVVRSRLEVKPGGEVVLQLFDQKGAIRVKLGAGEAGSGLLLTDETTDSGVHIIARQSGAAERPKTTSITLTGRNGRERTIAP
jgi:hypothetical protein